ncbi:MAG: hypothetical protein ACRDOV_16855 [Streptomyces sp.]
MALDISLYVLLGWVVTLAGVAGVCYLVGRGLGWLPSPDRIPSPARMLAGLLRRKEDSWLLAPRWGEVRLATVGLVFFACTAGTFGWKAAEEYQVLEKLREGGNRTAARVVRVAGESQEGWATAVTVRIPTPSGPVLADVDVGDSSALDAKTGRRIQIVYDPAQPTQVRHVEYLDGREADGIRTGALVVGLLATGFLVGTTREVLRVRQQTMGDHRPGPEQPRNEF